MAYTFLKGLAEILIASYIGVKIVKTLKKRITGHD